MAEQTVQAERLTLLPGGTGTTLADKSGCVVGDTKDAYKGPFPPPVNAIFTTAQYPGVYFMRAS